MKENFIGSPVIPVLIVSIFGSDLGNTKILLKIRRNIKIRE